MLQSERREWQCRAADVRCTNPRVTMLSGHVHDLCEEHRQRKGSTSSREASESEDDESCADDWEYQPMSGGDWKLTRSDLVGEPKGQERRPSLVDGVVFSSMFFHADVQALYACR